MYIGTHRCLHHGMDQAQRTWAVLRNPCLPMLGRWPSVPALGDGTMGQCFGMDSQWVTMLVFHISHGGMAYIRPWTLWVTWHAACEVQKVWRGLEFGGCEFNQVVQPRSFCLSHILGSKMMHKCQYKFVVLVAVCHKDQRSLPSSRPTRSFFKPSVKTVKPGLRSTCLGRTHIPKANRINIKTDRKEESKDFQRNQKGLTWISKELKLRSRQGINMHRLGAKGYKTNTNSKGPVC